MGFVLPTKIDMLPEDVAAELVASIEGALPDLQRYADCDVNSIHHLLLVTQPRMDRAVNVMYDDDRITAEWFNAYFELESVVVHAGTLWALKQMRPEAFEVPEGGKACPKCGAAMEEATIVDRRRPFMQPVENYKCTFCRFQTGDPKSRYWGDEVKEWSLEDRLNAL